MYLHAGVALFGYLVLAATAAPNVTLDQATITGVENGTLDKFLGIPYAQPPVGDLRFRLPQNISSYNQSLDATQYGYTCVAQNSTMDNIPDIVKGVGKVLGWIIGGDGSPKTPQSEDCLTLNVIRPSNYSSYPNGSLPVLVWIYGGGFESGSTIGYDNLTTTIVRRSMVLEKPVVVVSMNYRVNAFGFLASQEVSNEGVANIGLQDQRAALRWIKHYIGAFGGNSSQITIWGQSAGAISVSLQMLAYDGNNEDLFHGAFMQSGAPIPVGNITEGQKYYDQLVNGTNCGSSNNTLDCLRSAPLSTLSDAINQTPGLWSYQSLVLAWTPRADGTFLSDNPQRMVQDGKVSNVPMVSGNCADEGTLFSQSSLNVTSDDDFEDYIKTIWLPNASDDELAPLFDQYPSDRSEGSPFNTSVANALTSQYKRIAAFQGDVVFQAPRRFFLQHRASQQPTWSYHSDRLKYLPVLGSFHSSDLYFNLLNDYVIYFTYNLNPNIGSGPNWPQYTTDSPQLLRFPDLESQSIELSPDTYREQPMQTLMNLSLTYPI